MAGTFGTGDYQYELVEGWGQWPLDGIASDVATTSNGNVYVAVRTSYSGLYTREGDNSNTGVIVVFDRMETFFLNGVKNTLPHRMDYGLALVMKYSMQIQETTL